MPKGIAKGGKAKKSTKVKVLKPKEEELLVESHEVENQPTEPVIIEEIAVVDSLPVVKESKTSPRAENDRLISENATLQAQIESRALEIKGQNYLLGEEQKRLDATKNEITILTAKNENILKGMEAKNTEVNETLAKIEEATKMARSESDDHFEKAQKLIKMTDELNRTNANLDFLANQARGLIQIFRLEFIKYVQMNGIDIKIDYLTEEQKEIIAKTICPQLTKGVDERVYN